jgi:hypothetical protein
MEACSESGGWVAVCAPQRHSVGASVWPWTSTTRTWCCAVVSDAGRRDQQWHTTCAVHHDCKLTVYCLMTYWCSRAVPPQPRLKLHCLMQFLEAGDDPACDVSHAYNTGATAFFFRAYLHIHGRGVFRRVHVGQLAAWRPACAPAGAVLVCLVYTSVWLVCLVRQCMATLPSHCFELGRLWSAVFLLIIAAHVRIIVRCLVACAMYR